MKLLSWLWYRVVGPWIVLGVAWGYWLLAFKPGQLYHRYIRSRGGPR